jgi:hypothetical protein
MTIEFLLRRHVVGNAEALKPAVHALHAMARGGMYDVVGGGFSRYSVDNFWRVPHFDKWGFASMKTLPLSRVGIYLAYKKYLLDESPSGSALTQSGPAGYIYSRSSRKSMFRKRVAIIRRISRIQKIHALTLAWARPSGE